MCVRVHALPEFTRCSRSRAVPRTQGNRLTALPTLGDNYSEFDHIDVSANPELSAMPEAYSGKYPRLRITWPTAWGGC